MAVAVAVVVGLTRMYLRAHYLSDVLAGAGLSAAASRSARRPRWSSTPCVTM